MFLLNTLIVALIMALVISLIFMLDVKTQLKSRVFYFVVSLVLLPVVLFLFNIIGVIRVW